jgi:hypothetical protein
VNLRDALHFVRAAAALVADAVRSPRGASAGSLRSVAGRALDVTFEHSARLPALPEFVLRDSGAEFVQLPPLQLLEPGNQSHAGLLQLVAIARRVQARRIFEIGTYNGITALTLAMNLPDATIDTLDLPAGGRPSLPVLADDLGNVIAYQRRAYESDPAGARVVQHFGDSARFDFGSVDGPFDLVYVDGAHSWEYVESDTRNAFEIVAPGGAVVWDDYWRGVPDVPRFLHALHDYVVYRVPGTRLAVWFADAAGIPR